MRHRVPGPGNRWSLVARIAVVRPADRVHQELAFLSEYLDIQRMRFAIDPEVMNARVPVLLPQPLVENAIKHGALDDDGTAERLEHLLATAGPPPSSRKVVDRLVVHDGIRTVEWIEASGNCVRVHTNTRNYLLRTTMDRMAEQVGGTWLISKPVSPG